jgi:gluconate 2-dehydrogenase gamma chain
VDTTRTRREFLADSGHAITAGWLTLQLPLLAALASCGRDDKEAGKAFTTLTPAEARAMRAFAAQINQSDGTPGAEEAGAVYFVDRALATPYFAESLPVLRAGLADLDARARSLAGRDFAALASGQQVELMRRIEKEPFFLAARTLVVIGTLADPSYGGNRGLAGWKMIGMDHQPTYSAPFGWYDARPAGRARRAS